MTSKLLPRLSSILLVVTTVVFFSFLFLRTTPLADAPLGPIDKTSIHKNINWTGAFPPAKTAYVYTFATGRPDDTNRYIATIVGIESLKRTNTKRDIVVVVDRGTTKDQIEGFTKHGAIVHPIPQSNLFTNYRTPTGQSPAVGTYCASNFAPVYAWSLEQYKRVIWLDADVLPQINMDEFFLCGKFCMTFSNLQWYITSMMVLEPSQSKFEELMATLSRPSDLTTKLNSEKWAFFGSHPKCQTLFEDFLTQSFYQVEASPLFDPQGPRGQEDMPMMRLNMGGVMNPIYWYEKYSWDLARGPAWLSYKSDDVDKIPAHSIAFPSVKPYDWLQSVYWNMNWVWSHWRYELLKESYFNLGVVLLSLTACLYVFATTGLAFILNSLVDGSRGGLGASRSPQEQRLHQESFPFKMVSFILRIADSLGLSIVGMIFGFNVSICTLYFAIKFIPADVPYFVAWPWFAIVLSVFQHIAFSIATNCLFIAINGLRTWVEAVWTANKLRGSTPSQAFGTAQSGQLCTDEEWKLLDRLSDQVTSDPSQIILFFLQPGNCTISPLTQALFVSKIINWQSMVVNMLIIGAGYYINQFHIYPHFAPKIVCIFAMILISFSNFVKPFLNIVLVAYYAEGANWKRVKKE